MGGESIMLYYKIIFKFLQLKKILIYLCTAPTTRDTIQKIENEV